MKFVKKVKREEIFIFQARVAKRNERHDKTQNFSSFSLKFCLLGQKTTGTWVVNNTITTLVSSLDL